MRVLISLDDRKVAVARTETILGRAPDCDIVLVDKSVSRAHASIVLAASGPTIRDLGSRNGTWVNGLRLGRDRRLRAGDRIRLGCAAMVLTDVVEDGFDRDDGWLAVQCALLLKAGTTHRYREADEILFRMAEAIETRLSLDERFGDDIADAALAAVIDYATSRKRPGWIRWAMGILAKLGTPAGLAVRRSLENAGAEDELRASGTMPVARIEVTSSSNRRVG